MERRGSSHEAEQHTLPARYYTDPQYFERERERLLWRNWVAVARAEDVSQPGDYVTFDHAGEPVLVVRGRDDRLRAFSNVCRHRFTTLMEGCGRTKSLQCPYHLWTYDLAGELIGTPGMEESDGFERKDWGLLPLAVDTWGGWVFIHLDSDAAPLLDSVPSLEATYPGAYLEKLVRVGRTHCHSPWNWKVVVENFSESYHHAGVHAQTLQPAYPFQNIDELDSSGEPWSSIEHPPSVDELEPFSATTLFPSHLFSLVRPDGLLWFKLEIPSHDVSELEIEAFASPEVASSSERGREMIALVEQINAEDLAINARTWRGMHTRRFEMGPTARYEQGLRRFRAWVREAVDDRA